MIDFFSIALGAIIGVITGAAGNFLYAEIKNRLAFRQFDVCGTWAEHISNIDGREYSLGILYYDKIEDHFSYDGTSYKNDGEKHSHWQTISSALELKQKRLYYIFAAYLDGNLGPANYGFGVINLTKAGDKFVPVDGYFVSPSVEASPCVHSMIRVQMKYDRANNGKEFINFMRGRGAKPAA
jgi:hypothetical protein